MERMCWINWMFNKYLDDKIVNHKVYTDNKTIEVYTTNSKYRRQSAFSYCHNEDKFDITTGVAIAYARLIREQIPNCVLYDKTKVKDVKIGGMFVLKFNHKTYVKVCEHPSYTKEYRCTSIKNGEIVLLSGDDEVEKIY